MYNYISLHKCRCTFTHAYIVHCIYKCVHLYTHAHVHTHNEQNLGEAEYAVALFMYMRLQGYPPERIAILTTYNGQKHLIRDVLGRRCANNPVFGLPEKVIVCVCAYMHVYMFLNER